MKIWKITSQWLRIKHSQYWRNTENLFTNSTIDLDAGILRWFQSFYTSALNLILFSHIIRSFPENQTWMSRFLWIILWINDELMKNHTQNSDLSEFRILSAMCPARQTPCFLPNQNAEFTFHNFYRQKRQTNKLFRCCIIQSAECSMYSTTHRIIIINSVMSKFDKW